MSLLVYFLFTLIFFFFATTKTRKSSLPPGPPGLPLVGNIFQLGLNPHRSLAAYSKTYGPIMSLKLGRLTVVVISSPEVAKEALKTNDHVLAARTFNDPIRALDHHIQSFVWLPPSARWRLIRKILATTLLSHQNLKAIQSLRTRKVEEFVSLVNQFCKRGEAIDMGRASFVPAFNIISNALFSVDLATYDSNSSSCEFHESLFHLMELAGKPRAGDHFEFLRYLDLQGTRKEAALCMEKVFRVFQEIIDARLAKRLFQASSIDMLDSLLDLTQQKETGFTIDNIKHLFLDLFIAGTNANSSTSEWAMAELIRNPENKVKAQTEIRQVVGENGVVQESDTHRLPYLQAIVKETFRLHPPIALTPRKSESDVKISGFLIPKNSQDKTRACENPTRFKPERFLSRETDVKGNDYELLPFGSGRRMCPGTSMALKTMYMMLAPLLYTFDWKLQNDVVPENMDMSELFGLTVHKAKPLYVVPIRKPIISS